MGEETLIDYIHETLLHVLNEIDEDSNGTLSRVEFVQLCQDPRCLEALSDLDVDMENFESMTGFLFDPDEPGEPEKELSFSDMLKRVLTMRGGNTARVFDMMELNKHITRQTQMVAEKITQNLNSAPGSPKTPKSTASLAGRMDKFEEKAEKRLQS